MSRPFADLRRRAALAAAFGEYEPRGLAEAQFAPFVYGRRHELAMGADPIVSYDLGAPGRVREVKAALRTLGQAGTAADIIPWSEQDLIREARWAQLKDDDTWDDDTADELVAFLSRWAPRYMCYAFPLYGMSDGSLAQPTTNGLLLLDVALRFTAANIFQRGYAALQSCGYGAASSARLELFETALLGAAAATGSGVDLNPSVRNSVQVVPSINVAPHPIAPPDGDSALYSQWKALQRQLSGFYEQLSNSSNELARSAMLEAIPVKRAEMDKVAREIIAKLPPRTGTTTVECGDPNDVFDPALNRCVPKPASKPISAGWFIAGTVAALLATSMYVRSNG